MEQTPPDTAPAVGAGDGRTRDRVARLLWELGPATAAAVADRLELSPAAIRRHLDALVADGTVAPRPTPSSPAQGRRGRGRPARLYALTDRGRQRFPHAYDDVAVGALHLLREIGGEDAVQAFAETRVAELEGRLRTVLDEVPGGVPETDRAQALAAALSSQGYAATTDPRPTGAQLCQHHCPVQHVAEEFPELCEAETAALGRVLDIHVQRLATIAHGDGVCTTHIPHGRTRS